MGVKGLSTFLKKINGEDNFIKKVNLSEISGKRVGIDASIFIYRFLYKPKYFVESFMTMVYNFLVCGVIPIFVFDGLPPTEKNDEIQSRKDKKEEYQKRIDELRKRIDMCIEKKDKEDILLEVEKLEKRVITLNKDYVIMAQDILKLIGLPYIHMEYEAEFIASHLLKGGYIDYILSEDNDLFLLGCNSVLKDYSNVNMEMTYYNFDGLLGKLGLTYGEFVEVCLLVGVDYSGRLNKTSLVQAHQWIRQFKTIDNLYKFKIITIHPDPDGKIRDIIYRKIPDLDKILEVNELVKRKTDLVGLYEFFKKSNIFVNYKIKKIITFLKDDNHYRNFRD